LPNFGTFDLGNGNCNGRRTKGRLIELVERKVCLLQNEHDNNNSSSTRKYMFFLPIESSPCTPHRYKKDKTNYLDSQIDCTLFLLVS